MEGDDTIAAISTAPGEGAVALVRVSGPAAAEIAARVFRPAKGSLRPRIATYGTVVDDDAQIVDQVLVTSFRAPASFTGEDVVEIATHGGILLPAKVLELVLRAGARAAEPGEFTRRAFVNGKLDLTQAEAVMDLIHARTPLALRAAAEQLEGRLGKGIADLRENLLTVVAHLEAWIDFPEEDIDPASGNALVERISAVRDTVQSLLATADQGRILREGVRVAIVGRPNAGKSSLLNRLLGMDRAIVSPTPGTTRDTIEESACLGGLLFRLTDTAGLRETSDPVEQAGVKRSRLTIERADLVLHIIDASEPNDAQSPLGAREILVANKCDLPSPAVPAGAVRVSCLTGEGFSDLTARMVEAVGGAHLSAGQSLAAINARHTALLDSASRSLEAARILVSSGEPPELAAIELRAALDAIGRIIGMADTEEILGKIFSSFCIGK